MKCKSLEVIVSQYEFKVYKFGSRMSTQGFHVMSYQAYFASHLTRDRHVVSSHNSPVLENTTKCPKTF